MDYKPLNDAEYALMIEEEKRLCTKAEYIKATFQPFVSIREDEIVKKESSIPGIKLKKIKDKDQLQSTDSVSIWKMFSDQIKGELVLFLEIKFPRPKKEFHFCFSLNMKLKKTGVPPVIINSPQGPFKFELLEADEETANSLNWLELLVDSGGEISISDNEEPSVGITGVSIDIPIIILQMYGWNKKV